VNLPMTTFHELATYLLNVGGVTLIRLFALGGPALLLMRCWAGQPRCQAELREPISGMEAHRSQDRHQALY